MHRDFLEKYNEYKDKIYNHFYYRVSFDVEVAEDLTSETFLKAYKFYENYNKKFAFSTWIYTIAGNILIDYYRKNGRDVLIDDEFDYSDSNIFVEKKELEIDNEIDSKNIEKEIGKLLDFQKECMVLKFVDDLNYEEISKITNKKQNTIRQTISRAIKKIKKNLKKN